MIKAEVETVRRNIFFRPTGLAWRYCRPSIKKLFIRRRKLAYYKRVQEFLEFHKFPATKEAALFVGFEDI